MDADVAGILKLTGDNPRVRPLIGTFVQLNSDGTMTVDVQESRLTDVSPWTAYRPMVNERVAMLLIGQAVYLIGPTTAWPGMGSVVSVTSTTATVSTDVGNVTATINSGASLTAGQKVKLLWSDGAHVVGALSAAPAPVTPPGDPGDTVLRPHSDLFTALDAGTWNGSSGWWQSQVWASDTQIGAWFYGSKIRDTIRGGTVKRIQIYLPVAYKFGSPPNLGTHPHPGKPGTPTVSNAQAVAIGGTGWYDLPVSFGQYLAGNVGGIGTARGGFNKFASLAADSQSGALRIDSVY